MKLTTIYAITKPFSTPVVKSNVFDFMHSRCTMCVMALKHVALPVKLTFKNKRQIAPGVYAFNFIGEDSLTWKAGQHAIFSIPTKNGRSSHKQFSISSAPSEEIITFTTRYNKAYASRGKRALYNLKKGDEIKMRGPIGRMYIKNPGKQYALLATGIGITPFRSILQQLATDNQNAKVTLFYVGNKDNHFFREDFSRINAKMPNLKLKYIFKPDRITGQIIEETLGNDLSDTYYFLSGSSHMVKAYRRTLLGLGVPRRHIKSNSFLGLKSAALPQNEQ